MSTTNKEPQGALSGVAPTMQGWTEIQLVTQSQHTWKKDFGPLRVEVSSKNNQDFRWVVHVNWLAIEGTEADWTGESDSVENAQSSAVAVLRMTAARLNAATDTARVAPSNRAHRLGHCCPGLVERWR